MPTFLPEDSNDNPIPALRLKNGGAHILNTSSTSTRNTNAFDSETRIISLFSTTPVYLAFGDNTVTATTNDHFYPDGVYYDFSIGGEKTQHYTHIAVLAQGDDGVVYVSEKE